MSLNLDKSTWRRVKFGDVIDSITDRVDDPSSAGVDRYVGLEHLDPGVLTVERWDSPDKVEAQKLRFQPGDVIFGRRRAYQKKVARADFEGICSAHALVLRAKSGLMRPDFLPVFLASDYFLDRAIGISVGSLSPTVNWRDLKVQEFDLPPVTEQERLAALLWAVERHRRCLASLEFSSAQAMAVHLDQVLEGFGEVTPLGEVVSSVIDCAHKTAPTDESAFARVIGTPDVRDGEIDLTSARPVSEETWREWTVRGMPQPGDLIFTREAPAGEVGIVPAGTHVCLGQRTVLIKTHGEDEGHLVWAVLRSRSVQSLIRIKSAGSTVPHLNVSDLRTLPVPWVRSREGKIEVRRSVEGQRACQSRLAAELASVRTLRSALLNEIFGGN